MAGLRWPEARDALCLLLKDDRDFERMHPQENGRIHDVARAAAIALCAQTELDDAHVTALQEAVITPNGDEDAAFDALKLLETRPEPVIGPWLLALATSGPNAGTDPSSWQSTLPVDAMMAPVRRGDEGHVLSDDAALDALSAAAAAAAAGQGSEIAVPAVLAAAVHLPGDRLLVLSGVLPEEWRALLLVTVALARTTQVRRETIATVEDKQMGERLAQAIDAGRSEGSDEAAIVATMRTLPEYEAWLRATDAGAGRREILSMFERIARSPAPEDERRIPTGSAFMRSADVDSADPAEPEPGQ